MKHHWHITESDTGIAVDLARSLGVSKLLAQCLMNRGFGDESEAANFLTPRLANLAAPEEIPNLPVALERLFVARERKERIAVFGDYDVDGVTSATLLLDCLRPLGWQVEAYLPHRMGEGYGLTAVGVANCLQKHQPDLLLAVDCGSTSFKVITDLQAKGIEVIVLDHHQVSDPPPPALAIVNPQLAAEGSSPAPLLSHPPRRQGHRARSAPHPKEHTFDTAAAAAVDPSNILSASRPPLAAVPVA
jgi:single-stranded-DNA-specific exonuclease